MKKLLARFGFRNFLTFDPHGLEVLDVKGQKDVIEWNDILKVVFVGYFEEYSGYFLTNDYKSKALYENIEINCSQNMVKIRTGGSPIVKKNTSESFTTKFGTTCIYDVVFIEYRTPEGGKNLYALHYKKSKKEGQIKNLKRFLTDDKIHKATRADGFNHIFSI
ncbi:hypothetical protein [Wenyingzhuangia sp. 2_MG-2023]|uniref:hypothetical protein n=1 Tax=Wenyingzhuangia sp. 2_MG-2023 TaxID=3062639 RepID=UPI0026E42EEE|nr:hypothetical protein [Wenyingzhuangia sp. 2_MG-2023]MDO6738997.1 hypothetical protein [Wenyingzhuangia sp. 2_MG-2023]MDO6803471.1 hypothetical protein [Wenyingzhuangia sp. 1_MG-2023]